MFPDRTELLGKANYHSPWIAIEPSHLAKTGIFCWGRDFKYIEVPWELLLSEWGESNSRYMHPMHAYYHYTTLRFLVRGHACVLPVYYSPK